MLKQEQQMQLVSTGVNSRPCVLLRSSIRHRLKHPVNILGFHWLGTGMWPSCDITLRSLTINTGTSMLAYRVVFLSVQYLILQLYMVRWCVVQ